jgi:hypothetical protein
MGDWFQTIGDIEATPDEAEKLAAAVLTWLVEAGIVAAERTDCVLGSDLGYPPGAKYTDAVTEPDPSLTKRWTNGLEILTGRTIFDFGQGVGTVLRGGRRLAQGRRRALHLPGM